MDLTFGKEELAFQQEVRAWLKENLTPEIVGETKVGRNAYMPKERLIDWQKRLAKKGWLCTGWPKEFGGPGFTTTQKYIFEMEMAKAGAPGTSPFGPKMCAPVIDHLKRLGVTTVELMPVHSFVDDRHLSSAACATTGATTRSATSHPMRATRPRARWPSSSRWSRRCTRRASR